MDPATIDGSRPDAGSLIEDAIQAARRTNDAVLGVAVRARGTTPVTERAALLRAMAGNINGFLMRPSDRVLRPDEPNPASG